MTVNYMPSEIARLVLGYLRETNCKESSKVFIKESPHLTEYANGLRLGINYSTSIGGKSLTDIINNSNQSQTISNNNNNENNAINNSINEDIKSLSKQLSSLESCLTQLSETINTSIITNNDNNSNNCNNYQIIASPSVISSSSPLYVNTIGCNSTPIVLNEQNLLSVTQNDLNLNQNQFKTPNKSAHNSPRRKSLPRRRLLSGSSPLRSNSNCDANKDSSEINSTSDQLRDESESQLKIDINEPLVQPEMIVGELINYQPLHEALADNINKIFNNSNNSEDIVNSLEMVEHNDSQLKGSDNVVNDKSNHNSDPQEVQITDDVVNNIIANLELAPEYNTLLDIITEKELQMTPYKNVFSNDNSSSASSLNTPQTPQITHNSHSIENNSVVKNLLPDLRTPEKTVTLYSAQHCLHSGLTPIKVTPVKVLRTNLTPCKTLFVPEINYISSSSTNHSLIMPKVSVLSKDNYIYDNKTQNSILNNGSNYSLRVESSHSKQTTYNSSGALVRRGGKRVDFSKPMSELQVKRSDLMPRKILPKPSNRSPNTSTTITPVCIDANQTIVPKQPTIIVNKSSNLSNNCVNKRRSNSGTVGTPNKIRATETRFPTVNILRKMNVNEFLEQIHSNP